MQPLLQETTSENPHKDILIYLKGISYRNLTSIIEFMYLGQTKVSKEGLESFLLAAEKLQVEGLAFEGVEKEGTGKNQIISQDEEVGRLQERTDEKKGKEESVWGGGQRNGRCICEKMGSGFKAF